MTSAQETLSISLSYELPFRPEKVWRALTEPKLLAAWLMNTDLATPQVGHSFTFKMEPMPWWDGVVHCEVRELELHKRLQYTWRANAGATPLDTVVTWTLTPIASGTRLGLEQTGFVAKNKFAYEGARTGWEHNVNERMRAVLESEPS